MSHDLISAIDVANHRRFRFVPGHEGEILVSRFLKDEARGQVGMIGPGDGAELAASQLRAELTT